MEAIVRHNHELQGNLSKQSLIEKIGYFQAALQLCSPDNQNALMEQLPIAENRYLIAFNLIKNLDLETLSKTLELDIKMNALSELALNSEASHETKSRNAMETIFSLNTGIIHLEDRFELKKKGNYIKIIKRISQRTI